MKRKKMRELKVASILVFCLLLLLSLNPEIAEFGGEGEESTQ